MTQQRRSTTLSPTDWQRLDDLAEATGSTATTGPNAGQPSWRALVRVIVRNTKIMQFIERELTKMNITIQYDKSDDAMYGPDPDAIEGVDFAASQAKFEDDLRAALLDDFPNAEIEITTGMGGVYQFNGLQSETVAQILHEVWQEFDWVVKQD